MTRRTPPSSSGTIYRDPVPILVFSKEGRTVYSRLIHRVAIRLTLQDGSVIDAVRYDGRYWPTYKPEAFRDQSKFWLEDGDILYGPDLKRLKIPLEHRYLLDWDQPRGGYGW